MKAKVISRKDAMKMAPAYVAFVEGNFGKYGAVDKAFSKLKRGQAVITYRDGKFVAAKVSSIDNDDFRAIDGPVVRVSDGEYSYRVDGDKYAYPMK
jgi:hypothetical protein